MGWQTIDNAADWLPYVLGGCDYQTARQQQDRCEHIM